MAATNDIPQSSLTTKDNISSSRVDTLSLYDNNVPYYMKNIIDSIPEDKDLPKSENTNTVRILTVGEIQQGKSSFIKRLYNHPSITIDDKNVPVEGRGNTRQTTKPALHSLNMLYTNILIKNKDDSKKHKLEDCVYNGNMELLLTVRINEKNYDVTQYKYSKKFPSAYSKACKVINYEIIDTPGLNESDTADEKNIISILKEINKVKKINAVLFFTKISNAYSQSFKNIFKYYTQLFPSLVSRFIIIHTKYTIHELIDHKNDENKDWLSERENAFTKETGVRTLHFFIDSCPSRKYPYQEFLSLYSLGHILSTIEGLKPVDVSDIQYRKTQVVTDIDNTIIARFESENVGFNEAIKIFKTSIAQDSDKLSDINSSLTRTRNELYIHETDLAEKDNTGELLMVTESTDTTYNSWWGTEKYTFKINTMYPIISATKNADYCGKWVGEKINDKQYEVTVKGAGKGRHLWFYQMIEYATVSLYTTNNHKYADKIPEIKDKISRKHTEILLYEDRQNKILSDSGQKQEDLKTFQDYIIKNSNRIVSLKKPYIDVQRYLELYPLYVRYLEFAENDSDENQKRLIRDLFPDYDR